MSDHLEKLVNSLLDHAKTAGAESAEAVISSNQGQSITVRLGAVEAVERDESNAIALRVFIDGRNASISTSQLDEANIKKLATRAVEMAKIAPEDPYAFIAPQELLAKNIPQLDIFDPTIPSTEALKDHALTAENAAREVKGITNSEGGSASHSVSDVLLATSNGFSGRYQRSQFAISAVVLAEQDGNMERDYDYTAAVYYDDLLKAEDIGKSAAHRTLQRLGATRPQTGNFPLIYDNRVSRSIAGHIAGAISGSAIARGTSFLQEKLNQQITATGIDIIDDPLKPRGMGSSPFDAEGLPRQQRKLIDNGTLKGWLLSLASAKQLNLQPTGNAGGTSNWIMMPNNAQTQITYDDLIAGVDEGLLITEMIGSSVNLITGDYSRGASGFWIKNGKISHPITEATIAGNLNDMLLNMTLANDIDHSQATCAPSLRIDGMTLAGG